MLQLPQEAPPLQGLNITRYHAHIPRRITTRDLANGHHITTQEFQARLTREVLPENQEATPLQISVPFSLVTVPPKEEVHHTLPYALTQHPPLRVTIRLPLTAEALSQTLTLSLQAEGKAATSHHPEVQLADPLAVDQAPQGSPLQVLRVFLPGLQAAALQQVPEDNRMFIKTDS